MLKHLCNSIYSGYLRITIPELADSIRVKSHLTVRERYVLYQLSVGLNVICEIGSYIGASACCFAAGCMKANKGKVLCIDTWNNDSMTEGNWETQLLFSENTKKFENIISTIRGFSAEVVEQVAAQTDHIDLLFIDGDHSYGGVKSDWEAYKHFLRPGSLVAFHDWGWAEGVKRVIVEDVMPRTCSHNSLPNMWWSTLRY